MSLNGFEWNEINLEVVGPTGSPLNDGMVSIVAFDSHRSPKPIGTAFVIGAYGGFAVAITAAHNFSAVEKVQNPYQQHHQTALHEFLPQAKPINLKGDKVMAICIQDEKIESCTLNWIALDQKSDIAVFSLMSRHGENSTFFKRAFHLDSRIPKVGEEITLLGYRKLEIVKETHAQGKTNCFMIGKQLSMRCGYVKNIYPDGHLLCKGHCIETSIPLMPGMSGGPVMMVGENEEPIAAFGLISEDSEDLHANKLDQSVSGSSIIALLSPRVHFGAASQEETLLKIYNAFRCR